VNGVIEAFTRLSWTFGLVLNLRSNAECLI
jgi:hypothetical protein